MFRLHKLHLTALEEDGDITSQQTRYIFWTFCFNTNIIVKILLDYDMKVKGVSYLTTLIPSVSQFLGRAILHVFKQSSALKERKTCKEILVLGPAKDVWWSYLVYTDV